MAGSDIITDGCPPEWEEVINGVCKAVLAELPDLRPAPCEVSFSFVSKDGIRRLNKEWRGIDGVTDVLSFPCGDVNPENGRVMLGDIVICSDRAKEQAEEYGHTLEREVAFLTAHSALHLLGLDHETEGERGEMFALQEKILKSAGYTRD